MSSGSTFRKLTETELERQPEEVFDLVEEIGKARMGLTFVDFEKGVLNKFSLKIKVVVRD